MSDITQRLREEAKKPSWNRGVSILKEAADHIDQQREIVLKELANSLLEPIPRLVSYDEIMELIQAKQPPLN